MKIKNMLKNEANNLEGNIATRTDTKEILISAKFEDGHIHHIMPDEKVAKELVEDAASHVGLEFSSGKTTGTKEPPSEVIFKNRQAIGDILTFTCAIRDFKNAYPNTRVGVLSTANHIFDNNPHIDHQFKEGNIVEVGPGKGTNQSNRLNTHFCNAFRLSIQDKLGIRFPQGPIKPDIWFTQEEIDRKPIIDGPYWILIPSGAPGWPTKQYPKFQEVVNGLKDKIRIVQLGVKGQVPLIDGCEDYIGTTQGRDDGIRNLFNIFYHSEGSMGLVSLHMHLSAAFEHPCVVVAGAREPSWFTQYFAHQYISDNGCLPCATRACWACKLEACKNLVDGKVPKCVDIIDPSEVVKGVERYYDGGLLEYGKKRQRPGFANVVKEKKVFVAPKVEAVDENLLKNYGFEWGGTDLTDKDWLFLSDLFKKYNVKTVVEFGCGLSTLLYSTIVDKVISFETQPDRIVKISDMIPEDKDIKIYHWDGKNFKLPEGAPTRFDLAFVDGPPGGQNREWATKAGSELADLVVVHDAGREHERKWQDKYLKGQYTRKSKGGHRCFFWIKNDSEKVDIEPAPKIDMDPGKPLFRMISTCRGFGGSEKSTLYIMKMFRDKGYRVDLISSGNICNPYENAIPDGVRITDWSTISEPADITALYASDTIFGYHKSPWTDIMPKLNSKRKVMVLNYKIGGAGIVEWTKGWDKYMFLNSQHEAELLKRLPGVNTKVLAPPTDLTEFFKVRPTYDGPIKLIRHNAQRDAKHHADTNIHIKEVMEIDSSIEFFYMPAKSDTIDHPQIHKFRVNELLVPQFLSLGNVFWYKLPDNYSDAGPRVILECCAASLPVIADNHSGPRDRIDPNIGWLCDTWEDYKNAIREIIENPILIKIKGQAAREKAKKEFIPERWIEEILN